ncbi:hypothetical protein [Xanthobacter versatilis]|uniref:hypothetical protein n=1 Tax=Xanthobacter autotrophicus (strain ATCC BAA-1158 / Py2) TaxID=78245 RepID=UPI00372C6403
MDWLLPALKWLLIVAALSPIVLGIAWAICEGSVLPRLLPRAEIEAMADDVIRDHPDDPEEWAFMEEHAAWYRSHSFEHGKWHRVHKVIRRRLLAGDPPPAA